eukprot:TRINITY_DN7367_c0_g1_i1.p1 TRINITY_DN7367_c0_g1~~TRINITY_DN7367_c0_g1_i1.p1  ORF type:complete len:520 (+),score=212.08 TRINITY_DN7367_c0_g1_i1:83-1642(+)
MAVVSDKEQVRAALRDMFPPFVSKWVMMENAGGTPMPRPVMDRMQDFYNNRHVQMGGGYTLSKEVTESVTAAREFLGEFMEADNDAGDGGRVVMGVACRVLINNLAGAIFDRLLNDPVGTPVHMLVADHNHVSNIKPWVRLVDRLNKAGRPATLYMLNEADPAHPGMLNYTEVERVLKQITAAEANSRIFVSLPQVSNMLGEKMDANSFTELVHSYGGRVILDGVAYATSDVPHCATWGVDFYFVSMYKIFCPQMGVLYGSREAWDWVYEGEVDAGLAEMEQVSGITNLATYAGVKGFKNYLQEVYKLSCRNAEWRAHADTLVEQARRSGASTPPGPNDAPAGVNDSFITTPASEGDASSLATAVDLPLDRMCSGISTATGLDIAQTESLAPGLAPTGRSLIVHSMRVMKDLTFACSNYLRTQLASIDGIEVMRTADVVGTHCKPIVSFVPTTRKATDVAQHLYDANLAVKQGLLMSPGMGQILGVCMKEGVIRLSPAHYNTMEEMDTVLDKIREAVHA